MKITAVLLLATCLHAAAAGYGQMKITLSEKDAPVERIFNQIRQQTGYQFLYANQILDQAKKVTIQVKNADLEEVLAKCFSGQPFDYHIKDKTIIVRMKSATKPAATSDLAPPVDVKGRVVGPKGEPIAGATVSVQGTKKNTITDANGEFALNEVGENAVLLITHVQYDQQSVAVAGKGVVNAVMALRIGVLDEAQVIAYGTTTKRFNTGNVSTVKAVDIEKQPVSNPLLTLQGRVPGVIINQASGVPGSGINIQIQGQNSIFRGNDPLYIVDGVPYVSQLLQNLGYSILGQSNFNGGQAGNPLSFINPADIESISILKDADATAIYGSRAANGAILITTKKGKSGQTRVNLDLQQGWGKVTRKVDLLNTEQYIEMRKEAKKNDNSAISISDYDINGFWDSTRYTDWQKELAGKTVHYTNLNATISGGSNQFQYLVGTTYHRETTPFLGDFSDTKGSVHFNINTSSANQKFRFQLSGNYLNDNNILPNGDFTSNAIVLAPNSPALYNDDGTVNWMPNASGSSTWTSPIASLYRKYKIKTNNLIGNSELRYQVMPGLDIIGHLGYTNFQSNEVVVIPMTAITPENRATYNRTSSFGDNNIITWIVEPQINYKKTIGKAKVEGLIGATINQINSNGILFSGTGYNSDKVMSDIKSAATVTVNSSTASVYKYNALFGRVSFGWDEKYLINLSGRRDGSSRFGPENRFHDFGAIGLGWVFSNEALIKNAFPFISFGKLKVSYGTTGNDQILDYQYLNQFSPVTASIAYQGALSISPQAHYNPFLQWEETKKFNAGVDLAFISDRVFVGVNYYRNRSSNLILPYNLSAITGFTSVVRNFPATIQNEGWEVSINSQNIKGYDFSWSTNINFTVPRNKLISFPNLESSSYANSLVVGKPVTVKKVYHFLGVDETTGAYQFEDLHGNPTSNPNSTTDNTALVDINPKIYGGIENNFKYKGFELSVLFQGHKQLGSNYRFGTYVPGVFNINQSASLLPRWQKPGQVTTIQKYNSNYSLITPLFAAISSDAYYSDASYIRLKNLSLAWQFPADLLKKIHFQSFKVFMQCQNLLTITGYEGSDPEVLNPGRLSPLKVITLGLQAGF